MGFASGWPQEGSTEHKWPARPGRVDGALDSPPCGVSAAVAGAAPGLRVVVWGIPCDASRGERPGPRSWPTCGETAHW